MTADRNIPDAPLTPQAASTYLREHWGLKRGPRTLQGYRRDGSGPAFHRTGNDVRYRQDALDAWAAQRLGDPLSNTSERSARRLMAAAVAKKGTAA